MLVQDNPGKQRYEAIEDGTLAGFIDYKIRDGRHWLVHTELTEDFQGSGIGSFLVRRTLDDLRKKGATVIPSCPFVAGWIRRHPDYQPMVDEQTFRAFKKSRGAGRRRTANATRPETPGATSDSGPCLHVPGDLAELPSPWPGDGCAECIAADMRNWIHLRMCQGCGHVGCCDDSPGRHATGHHRQSAHPLIRSYEPGEDWWYCYPDQRAFQVEGAPAAPSKP